MTNQELRTEIEKLNRGEDNNLSEDLSELTKLQDLKNTGAISEEQEVLLWMFLKRSTYEEAVRWTAIVRGDLRLGKKEDGYTD